MDLFYAKLLMALFALLLIILPIVFDWKRKHLSKKKKYWLQIVTRTNTGSTIAHNRFYRYKSTAVIAAWWYGPDPKQKWVISIHTSINECNG